MRGPRAFDGRAGTWDGGRRARLSGRGRPDHHASRSHGDPSDPRSRHLRPGSYAHSVVELRSGIRRGNSGGPLVVAQGTVGGVVFGASTNDPDVGYAIGADEARESIGPYIGATTAVDAGDCL